MWGGEIGMAPHTAAGVIVLRISVCWALVAAGRSILEDRWLPVPAALAMAARPCLLWQAIVAERQKFLQDRAETVAQSLATTASLQLAGPVRALERMKARWERRVSTPPEEWESDAAAYLRDEKSLRASSGWMPTGASNGAATRAGSPRQGEDIRLDTSWPAAAALEQARRTRSMVIHPRVPLATGGEGYKICLPLFPEDRFDGFLIATIRCQASSRKL